MQMICIFSIFSLFKGVNLNPKRNSFLSSVFTGCKFSADTMYLKKKTTTKQKGPSGAFQAWTLLYVTYITWTVSCKEYSKAIKGHWLEEFFTSCTPTLEYFQICPTPLKIQRPFNQCVIASAATSEWTLFISYKVPLRVSKEKISAIEGIMNNLTGQCSQFILLPYGILSKPLEQLNYTGILSVPFSVCYHFF